MPNDSLTLHSTSPGRDIEKPRRLLFVHFFNHHVRHGGQVHAMLTSADAVPANTDLPIMPEL